MEKNTHKILDMLDSFPFAPKATFFVLGWISVRMPSLIKEIRMRGHEVASHGFNHHLPTKQSSKQFSEDLERSKKVLEDLIGETVYGYRAPSFAVNNDILYLIRNAGYLYDSSYNSFSIHGRYGTVDLKGMNKNGTGYIMQDDFYELPVSNLQIKNIVFPLGGGGYFRIIPNFLFKQGIKHVLKKENAFVFYSHPWEFDPDQPRVEQASSGFKFRHYTNLQSTEMKLSSIIQTFDFTEFKTCIGYLRG